LCTTIVYPLLALASDSGVSAVFDIVNACTGANRVRWDSVTASPAASVRRQLRAAA
jgi:hypothetical protein